MWLPGLNLPDIYASDASFWEGSFSISLIMWVKAQIINFVYLNFLSEPTVSSAKLLFKSQWSPSLYFVTLFWKMSTQWWTPKWTEQKPTTTNMYFWSMAKHLEISFWFMVNLFYTQCIPGLLFIIFIALWLCIGTSYCYKKSWMLFFGFTNQTFSPTYQKQVLFILLDEVWCSSFWTSFF